MVRWHEFVLILLALGCFPGPHDIVRGEGARSTGLEAGVGDGVQATLLSIAIALILALVAALVGPHFVDWNKYRAEFETQASRMTGLQVRVAGPIEARLLPTPSLTLSAHRHRAPGDEAGSLRARRLSIEFSLGSLVRGEWKATDVSLEGAEIAVALDRNGRLEWPAPSVGFDPEAISIERLDIRDSRALLADAASGSAWCSTSSNSRASCARSPARSRARARSTPTASTIPIGSRRAAPATTRLRVRLNVDPIDRPLTADAEGFRLDRERRAALCRQRDARASGHARAGRIAGRDPRALAADRQDRRQQHARRDRADRVPVRPRRARRSGCAAMPASLSAHRPGSTACCRRRRSISTASWRCRSRSAAGRWPRSRPLPTSSPARSGCRSRCRSASASKA